MAYTRCGLHTLWPTHAVAYTRCGLHMLWPTHTVAYTCCGLHTLWPTHAVAYTHCDTVAYTHCGLYALWTIRTVDYTHCGLYALWTIHTWPIHTVAYTHCGLYALWTIHCADLSRPLSNNEGDQAQKCLRFIKNEGDMEINYKWHTNLPFVSCRIPKLLSLKLRQEIAEKTWPCMGASVFLYWHMLP